MGKSSKTKFNGPHKNESKPNNITKSKNKHKHGKRHKHKHKHKENERRLIELYHQQRNKLAKKNSMSSDSNNSHSDQLSPPDVCKRGTSITMDMLERVTSDEIRKRRSLRKEDLENRSNVKNSIESVIQTEMMQKSPSLLYRRRSSTSFKINTNSKQKKLKNRNKKKASGISKLLSKLKDGKSRK